MRRRRRQEHPPSHDRWLVSYADFITLMFAFFVVMYSTAQVDQRRVGKLALAIQVAFQEMGVFPASTSRVPVDEKAPMPFAISQAIENAQRTAALGHVASSPVGSPELDDTGDLDSLRKDLEQSLKLEISRRDLAVRTLPDGLVISLREIGFFDSGSATIKARSQQAFERIANLLVQRPYRIRIEGHTDNVPIHNAQFDSNWELSTTRATEVVRLLITEYQFPPSRLSAAGYAEYHPVATNDTAEGRAQNRRVDIVVLGKQASAPAMESTPPRTATEETPGGKPDPRIQLAPGKP